MPVLGFVMHLLISLELAKRFDQGTGFALGIFFLPFVFYPLLGFGEYRFR